MIGTNIGIIREINNNIIEYFQIYFLYNRPLGKANEVTFVNVIFHYLGYWIFLKPKDDYRSRVETVFLEMSQGKKN